MRAGLQGLLGLGLLVLSFVAVPEGAAAATLPPGFGETVLASGFTTPVNVTWAPDGRMFVAERQGVVMVHDPGAPPGQNHELLDISAHVNSAPDFSNDRGLLGIAVDRDFTSDHFLYLLYTYDTNTADDNQPKTSTLTRVTVNPDDTVVGGQATPAETTILGHVHPSNGVCPAPANANDCIPSEGTSHSIGSVRVAPDGTLFVGSGTGASFISPSNPNPDPRSLRAYDEQSFAGKIIHIDRNGNGLPGHPLCPSDANLADVCTKIYVEGLRNPFRFDLLPGGGIAIGDVGENTWEELDLARSGGENFGWPCYEGPARMPNYGNYSGTAAACQQQYAKEGTAAADIGPSVSIPHPEDSFCPCQPPVGKTVIGGPEYTGDEYPLGYRGELFLGNFFISGSQPTGWIDRVNLDAAGNVTSVVPFATDWPDPGQMGGVDLEIAPDGNLAYVSMSASSPGHGEVREISYLPGNSAPAAQPTAVPAGGNPLSVSFHANASDADGDPLRFDWDFQDGSAHSGEANPTHAYARLGVHTATITVDDERGKSTSASVTFLLARSGIAGLRAGSIRFHLSRGAGRAARRRGVITGWFATRQVIARMYGAVWRGRPNARHCHWWSTKRRRLVSGSCRGLHFIRARLRHRGARWSFTLRLRGRLRAGSYTLVLEAVPHGGHEAAFRRERLRLRVPRR